MGAETAMACPLEDLWLMGLWMKFYLSHTVMRKGKRGDGAKPTPNRAPQCLCERINSIARIFQAPSSTHQAPLLHLRARAATKFLGGPPSVRICDRAGQVGCSKSFASSRWSQNIKGGWTKGGAQNGKGEIGRESRLIIGLQTTYQWSQAFMLTYRKIVRMVRDMKGSCKPYISTKVGSKNRAH